MDFDFKYRRQALQSWEDDKAQMRQEMKEGLLKRMGDFKRRASVWRTFSQLLASSKKSAR